MSEAEYCCDEGKYLADKYYREQERRREQPIDALNRRIVNQRGEIRRLSKLLNDVTQSRDYWKAKAERIGKQLYMAEEARKTLAEGREYDL